MASDSSDSEGAAGDTPQPRECMACRGSGQVISNLGGVPSDVTCPWCDGTGVRVPGIDAQARWLEEDREATAQPSTPESAP